MPNKSNLNYYPCNAAGQIHTETYNNSRPTKMLLSIPGASSLPTPYCIQAIRPIIFNGHAIWCWKLCVRLRNACQSFSKKKQGENGTALWESEIMFWSSAPLIVLSENIIQNHNILTFEVFLQMLVWCVRLHVILHCLPFLSLYGDSVKETRASARGDWATQPRKTTFGRITFSVTATGTWKPIPINIREH